jgi:Ca2+-transporting ATPase
MDWYKVSAQDACKEFDVKPDRGLSASEALSRLIKYGQNILATRKKQSILGIFLEQFKSPLIYILFLASAVVFGFGQYIDGLVILAVLVVNAVIGAFQEGKAKNSLEKLKSLTRHKALVKRDGEEILISSEEVVPGDILVLKEGDRVVADARLIEYEGLRVDESVLTGEAFAVVKTAETISGKDLVAGDARNMVFSGTSVVLGNGIAVVVATGFDSELGKISQELLETSSVPLPLALKIQNITKFIVISVVIVCILVFVIGYIRGLPTLELFGAVIGLSVSIIPEGLPIAVTIVLATGVSRMAKQKAIVTQMAAVEAMGNANVLLLDKTGTLTTGKMEVSRIYWDGKHIELESTGYRPEGKIEIDHGDKLYKLLELTTLSLSAGIIHVEGDGWKPIGDPTEAAIAVVCKKAGLEKEKLAHTYSKVSVMPFDSQKRYIEGHFKQGKDGWSIFVGAPDYLVRELSLDSGLLKTADKLTADGDRVVGAVLLKGKKVDTTCLFAIDEEIRLEVKQSIEEAKSAGFKIAVLTGDYPNTAKSIAREVGILEKGDRVMTGAEVGRMSMDELAQLVDNTTVFARITPEHKLKIVRAFQARGHVCAMTGDGVNDGPALQAANLGIGLGSGTQVAKDASDIVLTDDNFETIVAAISQGRAIYLTLKKVILYLFSTSLGEVLVIAGAIFLGLPLPVIAVQIIWLNFVTDGFFVAALAADPIHRNLTTLREKGSNLVDKLMVQRTILMGVAMVVVGIPVFYYYLQTAGLPLARTMVFLVLCVTQWLNALNVRSRYKSVFAVPLDNKFLIGSYVIVFVLTLLVIQTPLGNEIMHTVPLSLHEWLIAFAVSTVIVWAEEIRKMVVRLGRLGK